MRHVEPQAAAPVAFTLRRSRPTPASPSCATPALPSCAKQERGPDEKVESDLETESHL